MRQRLDYYACVRKCDFEKCPAISTLSILDKFDYFDYIGEEGVATGVETLFHKKSQLIGVDVHNDDGGRND